MNVRCYSCGYVSPRQVKDQHRMRDALNLHAHHSGKCPVSGGPIDPPQDA
jgi:hypothetical protein